MNEPIAQNEWLQDYTNVDTENIFFFISNKSLIMIFGIYVAEMKVSKFLLYKYNISIWVFNDNTI